MHIGFTVIQKFFSHAMLKHAQDFYDLLLSRLCVVKSKGQEFFSLYIAFQHHESLRLAGKAHVLCLVGSES